MRHGLLVVVVAMSAWVCSAAVLRAHSGPPFPIVSNVVAGPYSVSVWTDPDATDDGTAGGRFWITLRAVDPQATLPTETQVRLLVEPTDRAGAQSTAGALAIDNDPARRFAAVVLDHEGTFRVRVTVTGPLGPAFVDSQVDATYDLRPPPALIVVYLLPFVLVGFLWVKLMWRRRGTNAWGRGHQPRAGTLNRDTQD